MHVFTYLKVFICIQRFYTSAVSISKILLFDITTMFQLVVQIRRKLMNLSATMLRVGLIFANDKRFSVLTISAVFSMYAFTN